MCFLFLPNTFFNLGIYNVAVNDLPTGQLTQIETMCDRYLEKCIDLLEPDIIVGVGRYAECR